MNFKLLPTLFVKSIIRASFLMFCTLFPVNNNKITFASYRSEELSGNLLYLYKEFNSRHSHFQYKFLFKKYKSNYMGKVNYLFHMIKASYELATSRFFIIDDYYFPVYVIKPRKGTEVIQLWHAAGAFKKFGYSTINKTFGPSEEYLKQVKVHSNYSKVFVSSENVIKYYAEAFDMSENSIFPLGLPRTDLFFDEHIKKRIKRDFYLKYPDLKDKKKILYAPTFRGSSHYQKEFNSPIDISHLNDVLGNEYVLLIHLHPYMKSGMETLEKDKSFAYHISGDFSVEELLTVADLLVTDYSSIIFDYSLLNRPIAFFATDLEDYIKERDFYFDYKQIIPGPLFERSDELADWIKQGEWDAGEVAAFRDFFFDHLDGKASERIVNYLLKRTER